MNTKQTIAFLALIILVIGGIFMLPRSSSKEGVENPNYKNLNEFAHKFLNLILFECVDQLFKNPER
jgi:hypothetical protein